MTTNQAEINTDHEARIALLEHRASKVEDSVERIATELASCRRWLSALVLAVAVNGGAEGGVAFLKRLGEIAKVLVL